MRSGKFCPWTLAFFALVIAVTWGGVAQAENNAVPGLYGRAEYEQAYREMTGGNAVDGVIRLIELVRTVPGDDVNYADSFVGPAQLLGFGVASLLDWPERTRLLLEVLKPEEEPADKLLIAGMQAGSGIQAMAFPARAALEELSKSDHLAVRATALYLLGEPYYYSGAYTQNPAIAGLVLSYPQLEFTRCIIEMPVYYTLDKASKGATENTNLLQDVLYWGGRKDKVLAASPGLARAAASLPSMSSADITDATVGGWADGLADETDPRARYTVVSILAKTCTSPERRALARAGLQDLAKQPPATPDVMRARLLLAEHARADYDTDTVGAQVRALLNLGVLPCTAERSMYESVMQAAQHAARYYLRLGLHDMATGMHEALAAKFPDTALSAEELAKADAIRADGLGASMEQIRKEVEAPLSRGDFGRVRGIYEAILEHSPNAAVKAGVTAELAKLKTREDIGKGKIWPAQRAL